MAFNNSHGPMTVNELETPRITSNISGSHSRGLNETVYNEHIYHPTKSQIGTKNLAVTVYSESIPKLKPHVQTKPININIKKSIDILTNYIRAKNTLNTEHRLGHLKNAVEEIKKEIEEVQRLNGGVRRKRIHTHKRAMRQNHTRTRK